MVVVFPSICLFVYLRFSSFFSLSLAITFSSCFLVFQLFFILSLRFLSFFLSTLYFSLCSPSSTVLFLKVRVHPNLLQKPSIPSTGRPRVNGHPPPSSPKNSLLSTNQNCTNPRKRFRSTKPLNALPKWRMCLFGESDFWPNCKGKSRFSPHRQALGGDNPKNLLVYARPQPAISLLSGASHTPWNILHSYGNNPAGSSMNYD